MFKGDKIALQGCTKAKLVNQILLISLQECSHLSPQEKDLAKPGWNHILKQDEVTEGSVRNPGKS
jgi:hypothetical protein